MGTLDCGAMVIHGFFDVFDRAIGAVEHIEELLAKTEIPVQFHAPRQINDEHESPAHFYDSKGEMEEELRRAKEMIGEACQIAQNVMSQI